MRAALGHKCPGQLETPQRGRLQARRVMAAFFLVLHIGLLRTRTVIGAFFFLFPLNAT